MAICLLLCAATMLLAVANGVALERGMFGWKSLEVSGTRPLLVIWMREADDMPETELGKYKQYFSDVLFAHAAIGGSVPDQQSHFELSVPGYYREVSGGTFTWTQGGLIGPLTAQIKGKRVDEITRLALAMVARDSKFDFVRFDANRDGRLAPEELGLLVIVNAPPSGRHWDDLSEANRWLAIPGQKVAFAGRVAVVGENDGFASVNRELFHVIAPEAVDLDGWPLKCFALNGGRSLMAAVNTANPALSMHLDPWHKMLVGWIEPRVFPIGKANSQKLAAQHVSAIPEADLKRPILLFDASKGSSEFFLLEYRARSALGFDQAQVNSGLVVWQVSLNGAGRPFDVPADRKNCRGETLSVPSLYVRGAPNWQMGGNTAYWGGDGPFPLRWRDGTDTGVRVLVERHAASDWRIAISWTSSNTNQGRQN
jgi:hypothetical protein